MSLQRGQKLPVRKIPIRPRSTNDDLSTLAPEELERRVHRAKCKDWLKVADLILLGYVDNRMTLHRWVLAGKFPAGIFAGGERTKKWRRVDIEEWEKRVVSAKHKWDPTTLTAKPA